jgi:drug/metabolite transporter (DMT)-like permease
MAQSVAQAQADNRRARLTLVGLMALMALLWNVVEGLPVLLTRNYSLYQVVWMRYGAHLLILLLYLVARGRLGRLRTTRPTLQIGRGLLMLAMPFFFITAIGQMSVAGVMAFFWVAPLLVLLLAAAMQGDWGSRPGWLAAALGYVAVLLVLRPDRLNLSANGVLLSLGMAASFSLYVVLTRTLRVESTETNLFYTAAAVFLPLSLAMPALWQMPALPDALLMLVVGLAGLGLLWALDRACALAPVSMLAPYLLAPPLLAAALQPWLTGAAAGRSLIAGLIVAGVAALLGWWATRALHSGKSLVAAHEGGA